MFVFLNQVSLSLQFTKMTAAAAAAACVSTTRATATTKFILLLFLLPLLTTSTLVSTPPITLRYHHGRLLAGNITLHLIWYGNFSPSQRAAVSDFLLSLSSPSASPPSVSSWWATTQRYLSSHSSVSLAPKQFLLTSYPHGRSLSSSSLSSLAFQSLPTPASIADIAIILTADDVAVDGFCSGRCGTHANLPSGSSFIWAGDSSVQCPGFCAWPFHQPPYGPQAPPLVAPTGDVGIDGIVINLATLLAGTVTNPDGKGYFQGPSTAPLEAVTACTGIFGSGAYPGYPGKVLVDPATGASFNAHGVNERKYLLPAMWDPKTSQCATLV